MGLFSFVVPLIYISNVVTCFWFRPCGNEYYVRTTVVTGLLFFATVGLAIQTNTRTQFVQTVDDSGKPLSGITIHFQGNDEFLKHSGTVVTDQNGAARIEGYPEERLSASVISTFATETVALQSFTRSATS
ncbi:MAG: hypothetical protein H0X66_22330 [Verrucomicrobia bacterium]|nr:hypothetical protein [Verrucomicrobiota bacterium]